MESFTLLQFLSFGGACAIGSLTFFRIYYAIKSKADRNIISDLREEVKELREQTEEKNQSQPDEVLFINSIFKKPEIRSLFEEKLLDKINKDKFVGKWKGQAVSFDLEAFNEGIDNLLAKKENGENIDLYYSDLVNKKYTNLQFEIEYLGNSVFRYFGEYFSDDDETGEMLKHSFEGLGYGYNSSVNFFYIHDNFDDGPVAFGSFLFWVQDNPKNQGSGLWTIVSRHNDGLVVGKTDVVRVK